MKYREEQAAAKQYKKNYVDGLERVIQNRQQSARTARRKYIKDVFERPQAYREDFKRMLGWPLVDHQNEGPPVCICEEIAREDGYSVFRMQFEILDGLQMTGLLFKTDGSEKKPLVIVQHGGLGTPELIAGFYGYTSNYNDMLQRVRRQDVHVFAPQLLLWKEEYGVAFDRKVTDARLKRVGSSVAAIEIYGITRILDYFQSQQYVSAFGMVGMSYGGFYALYTAAIDTRIKSTVSCSFFNTRDNESRSDWTWFCSAERFDDAEIACLIYPRRLYIEIGSRDELFDCRFGKESFAELQQLCGSIGTQWTELIVFDGTHEFCTDDRPLQQLADDLKQSAE